MKEMNYLDVIYENPRFICDEEREMMFEPDLLRAFVMVAECKGFSRAAERMNSTQSTVSYQIKRLESQANRTFLHRTTRSISLTEDGEILMDYARKFLRLADDAEQHFGAPKLVGHIRLGASDDFATYSLPEILGRFRRIHPDVRLTVEVGLSGNLHQKLEDGELDLVLGKRRIDDPEGELVSREKLTWVASPDYAYVPENPVALAVYPKPCLYRSTAIEVLENADRPWSIVYTCPSLSGIRAAAIAGFAITPLAEKFITPDLTVIPPQDGLPRLPDIEFVLYRNPSSETPASRELGNLLLKAKPLGVAPWH
jgi:DNA-binding transcriptional LysR family regulator